MRERVASLDRKRRVHLGILRNELEGKPYERFFRWELSPLPDHVEQALRQGESRSGDVLPRSDLNRLLEPGYPPLETGWAKKQKELLENLKMHSKKNFIPGMMLLKSPHLGGFEDRPVEKIGNVTINVTESVLGQKPDLVLDDDEPKKLSPPRHLATDSDL